EDDDEGGLYGAAYDDVTYRDSTDDDVESEVLETGPQRDFDLEHEGERIGKRLRFLATVARLWNIACRHGADAKADPADRAEVCRLWLARAEKNLQGLLSLLDAIHAHQVPEPSGSYDSLVEFDRRRMLKEQLLNLIIATCLDTVLAIGSLQGTLGQASPGRKEGDRPPWEPLAVRLEQALWRGDAAEAGAVLPDFVELFRQDPLLFTPLAHGGHPRQILRAGIAQNILRALTANLPRLGLLRETYHLVRTAQDMEQAQQLQGPRITEFDRLFQIACHSVLDAVAESSRSWGPEAGGAAERGALLERLIEPFLKLWVEHSRTLRLSALETVGGEDEWRALRQFIKHYGSDLFHARFLTLANLRGILHRGV